MFNRTDLQRYKVVIRRMRYETTTVTVHAWDEVEAGKLAHAKSKQSPQQSWKPYPLTKTPELYSVDSITPI